MPINEKDINHIAHLARIAIDQVEIEKFKTQLEEIIIYIDKLKTLNVDEVKPLSHVFNFKNIYREDKKTESLSPTEVLKNAPKKQNNFFSVPKIIE